MAHAKKGADGKPLPVEKVKGTLCNGMAWQDGKLYVANLLADELTVYDARQGTIAGKLSVPKPSAVTVAGPGQLLVVSEGVLRKVAVADGRITDFAKDHLDAPQDVAVGPDGSVYVSNEGRLHNVSVFDKDGKFVKSIGKPGGRAMTGPVQPIGNVSPARAGRWDGDTLLNPRGLAVDLQGRNDDIILNAGTGLFAHQVSVQIDGTSKLTSTGAAVTARF